MSLLIFMSSVTFMFVQLTYHPTYTLCDTPLVRCINCCVYWQCGNIQRESLWQGNQFYWHFGLNAFTPKHVGVDMCHKWCVTVYIWWHLKFISYIFKFLCSVSLNFTSYFVSLVIDIYRNGVSYITWMNCNISLFGSFKREIFVRNEKDKAWWGV
jgi:hypothetical protein